MPELGIGGEIFVRSVSHFLGNDTIFSIKRMLEKENNTLQHKQISLL